MTTRKNLTGLVVGAATGLGRIAAQVVVESGLNAVLLDRDGRAVAALADELTSANGPVVLSGELDSDPNDLEETIAEAIDHLGRIDVLIYNPGDPASFDQSWPDGAELDDLIQRYLALPGRLIGLLRAGMSASGQGRVILIGPRSGGPVGNMIHRGLEGLTSGLADEWLTGPIAINLIIGYDRLRGREVLKCLLSDRDAAFSGAVIPLARFGG